MWALVTPYLLNPPFNTRPLRGKNKGRRNFRRPVALLSLHYCGDIGASTLQGAGGTSGVIWLK